jgi:hypothetical protein
MFRGNASARFTTSKPQDAVHKEVEQSLELLGRTTVSPSGTISISEGKFSGFGYKTECDGRIVERDGAYRLDLDFQAKPDIIAWIIAICLFPIGLAIFILPSNAKGDIQRKADRVIDDLKYALEKK